ncbi:MAG: phosphate/phosphite/phosphonate ABC transporter substrate-binding protein [Gammaproteobacteria bacterium]|nr:phosphate/phosphite/phosphonate ABC transporter substrate-binding protein [Gammaproteobacteria bacterium]
MFNLKPLTYLCVLFLVACSSDNNENAYQPSFSKSNSQGKTVEYVFGVHPLHNPQRLHEVFSPLMTYLSKNIEDSVFKLEASRNYAAYDKKLYSSKFDFALPNPFQTVNAVKKGYIVFGKMADDENFRGIILVRKDSQIESIADLKGKIVSYPAPTALAATMMPQYYIQSHGVDVMKEVDNRYVGSQESSIMNVFLKHSVAGATWPFPWISLSRERPELAEQLVVKWQTDPLVNNGLVVKPEVPKAVVADVSSLLFNLHNTEEGRLILSRMELSSFEKASSDTYVPVQRFLENFSREVRPLN